MITLYDFVSLSNLSYGKLTDSQQEKIDLFVKGLQEAGLEHEILEYVKGTHYYRVTELPSGDNQHDNTLPDDLKRRIDRVWIHLNDK